MATARKLPSGSYRVRVYSYTDSNDKQHYESFTAPTKQEAEMKAAKFSGSRDRRKSVDLTVKEAIEGYITVKTSVLSPSTIRGYRTMQRNSFSSINNQKIRKLTSADLQAFVSGLTETKSAKSVQNIYGLLNASICFYLPETVFRVTLPTKEKKPLTSPSDDDVSVLFKTANPTLKKCIALAAFGSLRRGEICALKYGDIDGQTIHVHADMIPDENNKYVYKPFPKTQGSDRYAVYPQEVIDLLGTGNKDDFIIMVQPGTITKEFVDLRNKLKINIRFHDLRAYFASIGSVLHIPDTYLAEMGGWEKNSPVMKEVYQKKIVSMQDIYSAKMTEHFSELIKNS